MYIVRVADGKGVEHWAVRDDADLMRQLTALLPYHLGRLQARSSLPHVERAPATRRDRLVRVTHRSAAEAKDRSP